MPIVRGATAPTFTVGHTTFTGLASPSRGAKETCVWRTHVSPGALPAEHSFDHEEVLIVLSGRATATLDGVEHEVSAGDAIVVPAHTLFSLANPHDEPLELVAALPVGALARMNGGDPFVPPTAQ
ncbi:cupin domain-containing protein [Nonomuraea lactucae]|uniref:cupin domain-containing protein n=1 Tax=Nonomuraea lactucae TaxID=2249762 RepID=UPI000DE2DCF5|nr:cupin domain-containing protein [Nonomuraea lactucae]